MTGALRSACAGALLALSCRGEPLPVELVEVESAGLPLAHGSVRFAVLGDAGTGAAGQLEVAARLAYEHQRYPFEFALLLGDNLYGREAPADYQRKFELPYRPLLDAGVEFYAVLGNHDSASQRFYAPFHMGGERYYAFSKGDVRFFALDSTYLDVEQLAWLEQELARSREPWRIAFLHHPLYSSGAKHGSKRELQDRLEPLFVAHGVSVVFAGHDHLYERVAPQQGVHHFVSGAAAKLRRGNLRERGLTARGFDRDLSFMLVEITGDELHFEAVSRTGLRVDAGVLARMRRAAPRPHAANSQRPRQRRTPVRSAGERAASLR